MSGQWINAHKALKSLPNKDITKEHIHNLKKKLVGNVVVGAVPNGEKADSLFHYVITTNDPEGWEILVILYRHTAYMEAMRYDEATAEDVAQDVMEQLLIKRATLNVNTNIGGWVRVLARNKAIDNIRRQGVPNMRADEFVEEEGGDCVIEEEGTYTDDENTFMLVDEEEMNYEDSTPEEELIAQETLIRITDGYKELSNTQKRVLDLLDEGCTYPEIADRVEVSEATCRKIAERALNTLKESAYS